MKTFLFALIGCLPCALPSGETPVRDLAPLIEPIRARHELPGIVAALVRAGDVVALGASGVRRRGDPEPITTSDKLHLGSCTKAMTATLCAQLVEAGKL